MFLFVEIVFLAYLHTADLSADGLRQFVHELDDTRILIGSGLTLDMILQLLLQIVVGLVFPFLA